MGALQMYDLKCELFEYNNEYFDTGYESIDALMNNYTLNLSTFSLLTEKGLQIVDEDGYSIIQETYDINENDSLASNDEIETYADDFVDFTEVNPFGESTY